MARYIDADKLIAHLKDEIKACEPKYGGRANGKSVAYGTELGLKSAISFAETLATADVAPKSEVAREIFEEIENQFELYSEREYSFAEEEASKGHLMESEAHDYALDIIKDLRQLCIVELKKKYTEGKGK